VDEKVVVTMHQCGQLAHIPQGVKGCQVATDPVGLSGDFDQLHKFFPESNL
jgi:hypothetical protein